MVARSKARNTSSWLKPIQLPAVDRTETQKCPYGIFDFTRINFCSKATVPGVVTGRYEPLGEVFYVEHALAFSGTYYSAYQRGPTVGCPFVTATTVEILQVTMV